MLARHLPIYISIPFLFISIIFILSVSFGIPLSDEWRWTKELLIPLLNKDMMFSHYMLGEYSFLSHSHYLALLFLYVDYLWFDLNFSYFTYVGLIFYILGYLAIFFYVKKYFQDNHLLNCAALLILMVGYFCITSDFPWLLVAFEYTYFFIAIVTLLMLDSFLLGKTRLSIFIVTIIACLLLGDTIGMAAVFVSLVALLINALTKPMQIKPLLIFLAAVGAIFCAQYIALGKGISIGQHSRSETLLALLHHPADVLISFVSIFSQPLVDITIFRYAAGERNAPILQFGFGLLGFIFTLVVMYWYFKNDGWKKSRLPLIFIGYSILTWALIFVSRYLNYGVSVMDEPRYVRLFTLIYAGVGVALLCINHTSSSRKITYLAACIFFVIYASTVNYKFWQSQFIKSYFDNARIELLKTPVDSTELSNYIGRCANGYCDSSVDFMKANHLSIFKDTTPVDASTNK